MSHHGPTFEEREQQQRHHPTECIDAAILEQRAFLQMLLLLPILTPRQLEILIDLIHMLTCPLDSLAYFVISPKGGHLTPAQQSLPILTAGSTTQLVATGYDKTGNVDAVPAGNSLVWSVSDTTLASIDNSGNLTIANDAAAGSMLSVRVKLATPLADADPTGTADQPIVAGEIASFIITPAPVAPPATAPVA